MKRDAEGIKWSALDYNYMTEESCDENDEIVCQHKLTWHSEGMFCEF